MTQMAQNKIDEAVIAGVSFSARHKPVGLSVLRWTSVASALHLAPFCKIDTYLLPLAAAPATPLSQGVLFLSD